MTSPSNEVDLGAELRQDLRDYFNAAGMAEPWDYERCVEEYVEAIVQVVAQEANKARHKAINDCIGVIRSKQTEDAAEIVKRIKALTTDKEHEHLWKYNGPSNYYCDCGATANIE